MVLLYRPFHTIIIHVCHADELPDDDVKEMKAWLQYNTEPKDTVTAYMAKTCRARASWLRESLTSPVREWPRLLDTPGMVGVFVMFFSIDCWTG